MDHPDGARRHQLSRAACGAQGFIPQCQGEIVQKRQGETAAGVGPERGQPRAMHTGRGGPAEVVRGGGSQDIQIAHLTGESFSLQMCCVCLLSNKLKCIINVFDFISDAPPIRISN